MKCKFCGIKVTRKNSGESLGDFSILEEQKILEIKNGIKECICMACRKTLLYTSILNPFY